jgi:hypothetical protein
VAAWGWQGVLTICDSGNLVADGSGTAESIVQSAHYCIASEKRHAARSLGGLLLSGTSKLLDDTKTRLEEMGWILQKYERQGMEAAKVRVAR